MKKYEEKSYMIAHPFIRDNKGNSLTHNAIKVKAGFEYEEGYEVPNDPEKLIIETQEVLDNGEPVNIKGVELIHEEDLGDAVLDVRNFDAVVQTFGELRALWGYKTGTCAEVADNAVLLKVTLQNSDGLINYANPKYHSDFSNL